MVGFDIKDATRKTSLLLFYDGLDLQDDLIPSPTLGKTKNIKLQLTN